MNGFPIYWDTADRNGFEGVVNNSNVPMFHMITGYPYGYVKYAAGFSSLELNIEVGVKTNMLWQK